MQQSAPALKYFWKVVAHRRVCTVVSSATEENVVARFVQQHCHKGAPKMKFRFALSEILVSKLDQQAPFCGANLQLQRTVVARTRHSIAFITLMDDSSWIWGRSACVGRHIVVLKQICSFQPIVFACILVLFCLKQTWRRNWSKSTTKCLAFDGGHELQGVAASKKALCSLHHQWLRRMVTTRRDKSSHSFTQNRTACFFRYFASWRSKKSRNRYIPLFYCFLS